MEKSRRRWLDLALLSTLIAVGVHFYLAKQHYALKFGAGTASICNVSERFNCDAVAVSSYSTVFGVPVAVFGATANAALLILLLMARLGWTDNREVTARHGLFLAALVLLASVAMGAISVGFMTTFCLFCILTYALSLFSFIGAWKGAGGLGPSFGSDLMSLSGENRGTLFLFLAIPAAAFFSQIAVVKSMNLGQIDLLVSNNVSRWQSAPQNTFDETRGLTLQMGQGAPKMVIVEFADYLCPHCRHAYPALDAFTQSHPDVKLVFKAFPLDGTCNPEPQMGAGDGTRCQIAALVQCEEKLNQRGWKANHFFLERQDEIMRNRSIEATLSDYCSDSGADCSALQACAQSSETKDEIRAMAQEGLTAGIRGTPSIFVNGRQLGAGQLLPVLEGAYKTLK